MAAFEELEQAGLGKLISADSRRGTSSVHVLSYLTSLQASSHPLGNQFLDLPMIMVSLYGITHQTCTLCIHAMPELTGGTGVCLLAIHRMYCVANL